VTTSDPTETSLLREAVAYLRAAGAPSLSCGAAAPEAYRLITLPSYGSVRIVALLREGELWRVEATQFEDPKSGNPQTVTTTVSSDVPTAAAKETISALDSLELWRTPSWIRSTVSDGQTWLIEARKNESYRIIIRHSPTDKKWIEAGRRFVDLAGWRLHTD
jgi:hypothetical protein